MTTCINHNHCAIPNKDRFSSPCVKINVTGINPSDCAIPNKGTHHLKKYILDLVHGLTETDHTPNILQVTLRHHCFSTESVAPRVRPSHATWQMHFWTSFHEQIIIRQERNSIKFFFVQIRL
jgi:hypothetical protein